MPRLTRNTVVIKSDVLERILRRMDRAYPNEAGYLLAGTRIRNEVFCISHIKPLTDGDRRSIWVDEEAVHLARAWAAKKKLELVGWVHSHTYPNHEPLTNMTQLSPRDMDCTSYFGFRYAFVVALVRQCWFMDCWRPGHALALRVFVEHDGRLTSYTEWKR